MALDLYADRSAGLGIHWFSGHAQDRHRSRSNTEQEVWKRGCNHECVFDRGFGCLERRSWSWLGFAANEKQLPELEDRLSAFAADPVRLRHEDSKEGFAARILSPLSSNGRFSLGQRIAGRKPGANSNQTRPSRKSEWPRPGRVPGPSLSDCDWIGRRRIPAVLCLEYRA